MPEEILCPHCGQNIAQKPVTQFKNFMNKYVYDSTNEMFGVMNDNAPYKEITQGTKQVILRRADLPPGYKEPEIKKTDTKK